MSDGLTTGDLAKLAEARAERAAKEAADAKAAADATAEKEYAEAAKTAQGASAADKFTNKRAGEQIFRREMGEPEFWLTKEALVPPRPVLSQEEADEITRAVEIPADQTPKYEPEHVLSPEFGGMSNYERGVGDYRGRLEAELERLRADPGADPRSIERAEREIAKMRSLYENYHVGMNVFRTAKGGRDKLRK